MVKTRNKHKEGKEFTLHNLIILDIIYAHKVVQCSGGVRCLDCVGDTATHAPGQCRVRVAATEPSHWPAASQPRATCHRTRPGPEPHGASKLGNLAE